MLSLFRSSSLVAGKQRTGIMSSTKEHAIIPMGVEKGPRCHGPSMEVSSRFTVIFVHSCMEITQELTRSELVTSNEQLERNWCDESCILSNGTYAEDCTNGNRTSKHKQT